MSDSSMVKRPKLIRAIDLDFGRRLPLLALFATLLFVLTLLACSCLDDVPLVAAAVAAVLEDVDDDELDVDSRCCWFAGFLLFDNLFFFTIVVIDFLFFVGKLDVDVDIDAEVQMEGELDAALEADIDAEVVCEGVDDGGIVAAGGGELGFVRRDALSVPSVVTQPASLSLCCEFTGLTGCAMEVDAI